MGSFHTIFLSETRKLQSSILYALCKKEAPFVKRQKVVIFSEINPLGIGEMRCAREIWLRHVKCLRAWGMDCILLDAPVSGFAIRKENGCASTGQFTSRPIETANIYFTLHTRRCGEFFA